MADDKLIKLRQMVGANVSDDELLLMYLECAERAILNRLYPMDDTARGLPVRYESRQIEIAAYLYSKRGAEGETSHTENGISRSYENGSIPTSMLSDIIPFGRVIL